MNGVVKKLRPDPHALEIITLTPEMAVELLEKNTLNRPLSDQHVARIALQIEQDKWRFNGDTIKIADTNDVLDGQHRLWAVVEAKKPIRTIIVYGIERDAFATIDTLRKPRSLADTVALAGARRHRNIIASALTWLIRWQRGIIETYKAPQNRIENSDVEAFFADNHGIVRAVEVAIRLRGLGNPGIIAFFYYLLTNRNEALAERMIASLGDPSALALDDPFFRLRTYFTNDHHKRKEPEVTIALMVKAANSAFSGSAMQSLSWRRQGSNPEAFPKLTVTKSDA
jgi:hypothetical protein